METEVYIIRIIRRAWDMTRSDFGIQSVRSSVVKGGWILGAVLIMFMFNWHGLLTDRVGEIWAGILAFTAIFVFVFLLNFMTAPARLQAESDEQINSLREQLNNRKDRQAAIDELWRLRSEGISLRNEHIDSDPLFVDWRRKYEAWRSDVLGAARDASVNLHNWLERLDRTTTNPPNLHIHCTEHERLARIASTMLERLQRYLERELFTEGE